MTGTACVARGRRSGPARRGRFYRPPLREGRAELSHIGLLELVLAALRPLAFNVGWNHGRAAGQHVPHLHVHVLPRYADGGRGIQLLGTGGDRTELAQVAAAIRGATRP